MLSYSEAYDCVECIRELHVFSYALNLFHFKSTCT
jgi:hypothetical protein